MLATLNTLVLTGIDARPVQVEVDIQSGLPGFDMIIMIILSIFKPMKRDGQR